MQALTALAITPMTSELLKKVNVNKSIKVSTMKNILVIFDSNPEQIRLYHLQTDNQDMINRVLSAHMKYINCDEDTSGVDAVNLMTSGRYDGVDQNADEVGVPREWIGILTDKELEAGPFGAVEPAVKFDYIVQCGFYI